MPTMNSWPARWAAVIREKTRAGQDSDAGGAADRETWLVPGRADGMLAEVLAGPAAGWPPDVRPQPEQARASVSKQPTEAPTT
jgi:hypothetical protein